MSLQKRIASLEKLRDPSVIADLAGVIVHFGSITDEAMSSGAVTVKRVQGESDEDLKTSAKDKISEYYRGDVTGIFQALGSVLPV